MGESRALQMLRWYLIHTRLSREALARRNLSRQGYEVYLPRAWQAVWRAGRGRERIVALFPRYLFVRLNEGLQALGPVRSTPGVADIVRFGSRYAIVPDQAIRDLHARADPVTGLHRLNCTAVLTPGAVVRISTGLFDGLEGIFTRQAGAERAVVLLRLLGQTTSVCVPVHSIALAHAG